MSGGTPARVTAALALAKQRSLGLKLAGLVLIAPGKTWSVLKAIVFWFLVIASFTAVPAFVSGLLRLFSNPSSMTASEIFTAVIFPGMLSLVVFPVIRKLIAMRFWARRNRRLGIWDERSRMRNRWIQKWFGIAISAHFVFNLPNALIGAAYANAMSPAYGFMTLMTSLLVPAAVVGGYWLMFARWEANRNADKDGALFAAQNARDERLAALRDVSEIHSIARASLYKAVCDNYHQSWIAAQGWTTAEANQVTAQWTSLDWSEHFYEVLSPYIHVSDYDSLRNRRLRFDIPVGKADADAIMLAPLLRSALRLQNAIVMEDEPGDGIVVMMLIVGNPLETHLLVEDTPVLHISTREKQDVFHELKVAIGTMGEDLTVPLYREDGSVRTLIGGVSGAGKSGIPRQQLTFACQNENIKVFCLDGKGTEFSWAQGYADIYRSKNKTAAFDVLEAVEEQLRRNFDTLEANAEQDRSLDVFNPQDDGERMIYWLWDEPGIFRADMTPNEWKEYQKRLYGVASTGRSGGLALTFSSQTWRGDMLDPTTRENCFDMYIGFRLNQPQDSTYLNFDSSSVARPDLIRGRIVDGRNTATGQFALLGGEKNTYGKSYFLDLPTIRTELARAENAGEFVLSPEAAAERQAKNARLEAAAAQKAKAVAKTV